MTVRLADTNDLDGLLALYAASGFSAPASQDEASAIWQIILAHPGTNVVVAGVDGLIVASCTLIIAPNLLRGGKAHGFLENVATHPDHRGRGHGSAVVQFALSRAWRDGCYHVMLQSGCDDERVHAFYRKQGFRPGLRTAYVVRRGEGE
jgi:GNAT superfamily N-acetyltransferase